VGVLKTRRRRVAESATAARADVLGEDYFRVRDFEYVQPLYDLAFLLEVEALAKGAEVPKYRTFSLWRAAYSLDGYTTNIDRWLDGALRDDDLDYVPSGRIRQYLTKVRTTGSIPELHPFRNERFERCLRLRSVRGLGPSKIALTVSSRSLTEEWFTQAAISLSLHRDRISELYRGNNIGPWQAAHVVPPLLRLLHEIEVSCGRRLIWDVFGIHDPLEPINGPITVALHCAEWDAVSTAVGRTLRRDRFFRRDSKDDVDGIRLRHRMGWSALICANGNRSEGSCIETLAQSLDPLVPTTPINLLSDLHTHTAWSDGSASVNTMAKAVVGRGLKYFAVTDHSRSSKLQGGLTPPLWLRQSNALTLAGPVCPVLHGIEVDIHRDGTLDLPASLLAAADIVVASVHSNWSDDIRTNTDRLLKAIESGSIDVMGHPTSALIGKPGVPDYVRAPADVNWDEVFNECERWHVAVEFNCFPSRLDLPVQLLHRAVKAGCALSLGSDAHARAHLSHLRFGQAALRGLESALVLNRLSYEGIRDWIQESRKARQQLARSKFGPVQTEIQFDVGKNVQILNARVLPPQPIPSGSRVVGLDLTAGQKATGVALLEGLEVKTCSLVSDEEILDYVQQHKPAIVSIDSPLGLPGGGNSVDPRSGIVRVAEHDLASIGIPAYPALIDSMKNLTLRGIRLRRLIEQLPCRPHVIESYPGAAQDILCLPRKQKGLDLLREGLRRLGLTGGGLAAKSHDEMDAITSAIVGRYYESGLFEPMGIPSEAELIVPKVRSLGFDSNPVICLAGKTGAGKSVVARYLSVFYGFSWMRTRDVIRQLLIKDSMAPENERLFHKRIQPSDITERDLREFGALILEVHHQIPLRRALSDTVAALDVPIVVDSVRDANDVDRAVVSRRPVFVWFIDCAESVLRERLAKKTKLGQKRPVGPSPVDRTAPDVQRRADRVIPNSSSLEELRWRLDDVLFSVIKLNATY
jgi:histidinol phosphatase-like PHP family hydrolase/predicted nuclease with RNAse H fold/dephospho-CoA kinase